MSDRNTGGHHSRTVTLRRLGWLGAVRCSARRCSSRARRPRRSAAPKCGCSTSTTSTQTTSTETSDVSETTSTQSTQTTETSDVSETTSTQTTETSDVSETTSTQNTETSTTTGDTRWRRRWRDRHAGRHPAVDELAPGLLGFQRWLEGHPPRPRRDRGPEPDPPPRRPEALRSADPAALKRTNGDPGGRTTRVSSCPASRGRSGPSVRARSGRPDPRRDRDARRAPRRPPPPSSRSRPMSTWVSRTRPTPVAAASRPTSWALRWFDAGRHGIGTVGRLGEERVARPDERPQVVRPRRSRPSRRVPVPAPSDTRSA